MYKEYLAEFWCSAIALDNSKVSFLIPSSGIYGEVGVNTFRNVIGAHYLPYSSEYVAPPSIDIVRPWFETIRHRETVLAKGTLKKSLLPPRWRLLMAQIIQCLGDIIIKLNKRHREKVVPYTRFLSLLMMHKMKEGYVDGTKPGAQPGHNKQSTSLKQPSVSNKEETKGRSSKSPTGSKTGHSKKKKESNSTMDSNPSQPSVSTPVDTKMHKDDQQATGGPTSLGVTGEEGANPQLSSASSKAGADSGLFALKDSISQTIGPPFTKHMLDICKANAPVAFKAPKPSLKFEKKVTQCANPRAT
nr:hypothetical protein [Tanacetum cinerariifolium]